MKATPSPYIKSSGLLVKVTFLGIQMRLRRFGLLNQSWECQTVSPNPVLNVAPFGRWPLRDKAAHRRLALLVRLHKIRRTPPNP